MRCAAHIIVDELQTAQHLNVEERERLKRRLHGARLRMRARVQRKTLLEERHRGGNSAFFCELRVCVQICELLFAGNRLAQLELLEERRSNHLGDHLRLIRNSDLLACLELLRSAINIGEKAQHERRRVRNIAA